MCEPSYKTDLLEKEGIAVTDLVFDDGTFPPAQASQLDGQWAGGGVLCACTRQRVSLFDVEILKVHVTVTLFEFNGRFMLARRMLTLQRLNRKIAGLKGSAN